MLIAQQVIAKILGKPFRYRDFSKIGYGELRRMGLVSLQHRRRLHAHHQLDVRFMDLYNQLVHDRNEATHKGRLDRINHIRLRKKQLR